MAETEAARREREYWDRHARNYDRSMRVLGGPMPRMLALVAQTVRAELRPGGEVLEVAAGTGLVTEVLAEIAVDTGATVTATDYSEEMVREVRLRMEQRGLSRVVWCEEADLYELLYEDASFDVVVAANVLHLVPDLPRALAALLRVLRPGGRLVVPTFCHDQTWWSRLVSRVLALTGFPGHRRFSTTSLRAAVQAAGAEVARVETLRGLLPIGYVEAIWPGAPAPVPDASAPDDER